MKMEDEGLVCDLVWSDPATEKEHKGWAPNKVKSPYFPTSKLSLFKICRLAASVSFQLSYTIY